MNCTIGNLSLNIEEKGVGEPALRTSIIFWAFTRNIARS